MKQLPNSSIPPASLQCGDLLIDVVPLVMAAIRGMSAEIKPADLTVPQFRGLAFVDRHAGLSMSALADFLGLTLSAVSKHVERMVRLGYLVHEVCPDDRRRARLYASEQGRATIAAARAEIGRRLGGQLGTLAPQVLAQIGQGLQALQEVFTPDGAAGIKD